MIRAIQSLEHRGSDPMGGGWFGAPRGARTHKGIDYTCEPGTLILAPVFGVVSKIGLPYANEHYRYVEIRTPSGVFHRIFYVYPIVTRQQEVTKDTVIGHAQDIVARKPYYGARGMKNHVHYEVRLTDGTFVDPEGDL